MFAMYDVVDVVVCGDIVGVVGFAGIYVDVRVTVCVVVGVDGVLLRCAILPLLLAVTVLLLLLALLLLVFVMLFSVCCVALSVVVLILLMLLMMVT